MHTPVMEIVDADDEDDRYSFRVTRSRAGNDEDEEDELDRSIFQSNATSDPTHGDHHEEIQDLLALSSIMSHHVPSDHFLGSESSLIRSKFLRLFHFLLTDVQNEPMGQALGDAINTADQLDDALIHLSRNTTLKYRNYRQFRELLNSSAKDRTHPSNPAAQSKEQRRPPWKKIRLNRHFWFQFRDRLHHHAHRLIQNRIFKWFISAIICLDAITLAIAIELNSPGDSQSVLYHIAMYINRLIVLVYLLELGVKWLDSFTNFWYSPINILEFLLTLISAINLVNEIYFDAMYSSDSLGKQKLPNQSSAKGNTLEKIRWYGSILSLLRTLRMLRVLRILEIAFRFAHVRIVFLALSRSVKLIFHVVLLTVVLNYFFALIALYLTQFGLNNTSYGDKEIIQSLFGTVPRAFITVFRLFTKDEWYEIKAQMYGLNISPIIVDVYVVSWLFFGGYVLNPLLVGAMVGTFDETRKELTDGIDHATSKTRLSLNEGTFPNRPSSLTSFSSLLAPSTGISMSTRSLEQDQNQLDKWIRSTLDDIHRIVQDRMETQWPIYTAFYYLQLLELYFENIAERQLLLDFFSMYLLMLHDKETRTINPPILTSSSSSSDNDD